MMMRKLFLATLAALAVCTFAHADRLYVENGAAYTVQFELYETDGVDLKVDAVHASGDTTLICDGATQANTTNGFTDEGSSYSIVITAAELAATTCTLHIVDQSTKAWLDRVIHIETYTKGAAFDALVTDHTTPGTFGGDLLKIKR